MNKNRLPRYWITPTVAMIGLIVTTITAVFAPRSPWPLLAAGAALLAIAVAVGVMEHAYRRWINQR